MSEHQEGDEVQRFTYAPFGDQTIVVKRVATEDWVGPDGPSRVEFYDGPPPRKPYVVISDFPRGTDIDVLVNRWCWRHLWRPFTARKMRAAARLAASFALQHRA